MNRLLFELLLLLALLTVGLAEKSKRTEITAKDVEEAFEQAEKEANDIRELEIELPTNGGIIAKDKFSPEARHQGRGGDDISHAMNLVQESLLLATLALKENKSLSNEQVDKDVSKVDLEHIGSPRARDVYQMCRKLQQVESCGDGSSYRTADGSCNNLNHPTWGRAHSCARRLLKPSYADGVKEPRKSVTGECLPNPRALSTMLHNDEFKPDQDITQMLMQWGQFLDHDIALAPMIRTDPSQDIINCCSAAAENHPDCIQISIPQEDDFYKKYGKTCLNLVRSSGCSPNCSLGPKNMVNMPTSFVDGSNVYGSSQEDQNSLRQMEGGLLKSAFVNNIEYLPSASPEDDNQCTNGTESQICYMAGDERANEHPGLTSMHTVWVREHNNLARALQNLNSGLTDEEIFQTVRKIVGAMMQHITYSEFLSIVLGPKYSKLLSVKGRTVYDRDVDPTIMTDFSTAPYRFGHTLIPNDLKKSAPSDNLSLVENYFNLNALKSNQLPSLVSGMSEAPAQKFDPHVVKAVTNHVYQVTGTEFGLDLPAINIQRGRDHGLGAYAEYLKYCKTCADNIKDFDDLKKVMTDKRIEKLAAIYTDVKDIDLFTGGLFETPVKDGVVGPTFACIITEQFRRFKDGDRFFYLHDGSNGSQDFDDAQLKEIQKTKLASVLCRNSGIREIGKNAFLQGSRKQSCDKFEKMDLSVFV